MKKLFLLPLFILFYFQSISQVSQTANDNIEPYLNGFRPASNLGYYPPFTPDELANLAAGNEAEGIQGLGIKTLRPVLHEAFVERFGYDFFEAPFDHYEQIGLEESTVVVGFPSADHQDPNYYCSDIQSELFDNLYTPIWDNGENGTPVNDDNYYALYLYRMVQNYKDDIRFWEIWNEPGFDFTRAKGFLPPGQPGNWWDNNPDPCDYKLRAPIQHYIRILRISYQIIHTFDPDSYVTVSGLGFPSFLDAILRNTDNPNDGSVSSDYPLTGGAYIDVIGYHSYPHFDGNLKVWDPVAGAFVFSRHSDAAAEAISQTKDAFQDVLDTHGYDGNTFPEKHWIITEVNIPRREISDFVGGDEVQRNFVIKAYVEAVKLDLVQLHYYQLAEIADTETDGDEFNYMGFYKVLDQNNQAFQELTEGGVGIKTCSDELFGKTYDPARTSALQLPNDINGAAFFDDQNNYTYVLWAKTDTDMSEQASANYSFPSSLNITGLRSRDWDFSESKNERYVSAQNINLSAAPVFFTESTFSFNAISCAGQSIDFEALNVGSGLTYSWNFEGGSPSQSTSASPNVTFDDAGSFEVRLEISNAAGNVVTTQTSEIQILDRPSVSFDADESGQIVIFTADVNSTQVDFDWDFGDGQGSTDANPTNIYNAPGSYNVVLNVTNTCGTTSSSSTFDVSLPNDPAPTSTANNDILPYDGYFRPGSNLGYFGQQWQDEMLADIASGNPLENVPGVGVKVLRPSLPERFLETFGYEFRVKTFEHYQNLGNEDNTLIIGFPSPEHREQVNHCQSNQSELFAGMYEDIWDNGENGTPVNDDNYFALYLYNTATLYKDYVKFWEIWNEPGFDFTNIRGFLPPGQPGNWWDNDPDPCDYKLRAPVQYMVRMLRISYEVIKSVDEEAFITFSGIGFPSFLDAVLRNTDNPNGGSVSSNYPLTGGAYFDVVGFHSYPNIDGSLRSFDSNLAGFTFNRHSDAAANGILNTQSDFQNVLDQYGYDGNTFPEKHWIITECNIPRQSFDGGLGGEDAQVNYVIKALVKSKLADMLQLHMYQIAEAETLDNASDEFQAMGLYEDIKNSSPYEQEITNEGVAFKTASDQLFLTEVDEARTTALNLPAEVDGAAFVDPEGNYTYVLWAKTNTDRSEQASANFSFPSSLNIDELFIKEWDFSNTGDTQISDGQNIALTGRPIFLSEEQIAPSLPTAFFGAEQAEGCFPLTVNFNSFTQAGDNTVWQFPGGNPATSTDPNPVITYENPGSYTVNLEVSNAFGTQISNETEFVFVRDVPTASFEHTTQNRTVNFQSTFSNADNLTWNFGDGRSSNGFNPTHTYQEEGTYTVSLTVSNDCGENVITEMIAVGRPLLANNNIGCAPLTSIFLANLTDVQSVLWSFPGGQPFSSTVLNPTISYAEPGTYPVTLEVTTSSGTEIFEETNFVVVSPAPDPSFELDIDFPRVNFINTSINSDSFSWNLGNGSNSQATNPSTSYDENGTYIITLNATGSCGTFVATSILNVEEPPQAEFTVSKTTDCTYFSSFYQDVSTYGTSDRTWFFEGGTPATSTEQSLVVSYPNPGTYNVVLMVSNEFGTDEAISYDMIVHSEEAPEADFDFNQNGLTVNFENLSSENSTYLWEFGDGETSTSANPIHEYAIGGTYMVRLEVSNGCGTRTTQQTISTSPRAEFDFTVEPDCLPLVVRFEDNSTGNITSRTWNFPGGNPASSSATNPTVTYNTAGIFDVSLSVTNSFGTDTNSKFNIIVAGEEPSANFEVFVEERRVTFTPEDLTADAYLWEFGDGETSTQIEPVHTYDDLGDYNATLTITNACGEDEQVSNIQLDGAPDPQFSANQNSGCATLVVNFLDESGGTVESRQWLFEGGSPSSSASASPTVRYEVPGVYPVTLTVFNAEGSNVKTISSFVEVEGPPNISILTQISGSQVRFSGVEGDIENYSWDFGDGNTSTEVAPVHVYANAGNYEVVLIVETNCGTFEFKEDISILITPTTFFGSDINSACGDLEVQFFDLSSNNVTSWAWTFPNGSPSTSSEKNPVVSYTQIGTYPVTLTTTNAAGSSTETITDFINVFEQPIADFEYDIEIEDGMTLVNFTNTSIGAATYSWDFDEGPYGADTEDTFHLYPPGEYDVTLTITNDCGSAFITKTIFIEVVSTRDISLEGAFDIFPNPSNGHFVLIGEGIEQNKINTSLTNLLGQEIEQRTLSVFNNQLNESFDLNEFAPGTYFLTLSADGKTNSYKVIIAPK